MWTNSTFSVCEDGRHWITICFYWRFFSDEEESLFLLLSAFCDFLSSNLQTTSLSAVLYSCLCLSLCCRLTCSCSHTLETSRDCTSAHLLCKSMKKKNSLLCTPRLLKVRMVSVFSVWGVWGIFEDECKR